MANQLDNERSTCQHYDIPYTERKCPKCGTVFYACPICYPWKLCDVHRAEQINRLIDNLLSTPPGGTQAKK